MFKRVHIFFTFISVVTAQFAIPTLSPECTSTLAQVAGNPDASSCLNIPGIVAITTAPATTSLVSLADAWLSGVCKASPCQQATLQSLVTNITTSCAKGLPVPPLAVIAKLYPTFRDALCLKDNAAGGQLCTTEKLSALETAIGQTLTRDAFTALLMGSISPNVTSIPKNVVCGACTQAEYNILQTQQPELLSKASPTLVENIKKTCGDTFFTGGFPSTISKGATVAIAPGSAATALMPVSPLHWFGFAATSSLAGIMAVLL